MLLWGFIAVVVVQSTPKPYCSLTIYIPNHVSSTGTPPFPYTPLPPMKDIVRRRKASQALTKQALNKYFLFTHRPLSSSFLGSPHRILSINHKKELLRGLWVGSPWQHLEFYHVLAKAFGLVAAWVRGRSGGAGFQESRV